MLDGLAQAVTGRVGRWIAIAVWIPLAIAGVVLHSHLDQVTAAGQSSFLPAHAESTEVVKLLEGQFAGGSDVPVMIVFGRHGGLTAADKKAIGKIGGGLEELGIKGATQVFDPYSGQGEGIFGEVANLARGVGPISRNGEAALVVLALDADDRGAIVDGVDEIRRYLHRHQVEGLTSHVTGPAGMAADLEQVADEAGETLLIATVGLVLILLLLVYRAPALALLPMVSVGFAYAIASGIAYLLIEAGAITVNSEGTMLLLVLTFGAGTDYSLLLVHRYREELSRGAGMEEALPLALRESLPALAASAGTVIAAMLVLLLADLESTRWLGPILAIGIGVVLLASLTLLPAILSLLGPRAFWPGHDFGAREPSRRWARIGDLIRRRARLLIVTIFAGLIVLSLGNLVSHGTLGFGQGETRPTDSSRGTALIDANFPPGLGSPLSVIVDADNAVEAVKRMESLPTVKLAVPAGVSRDAEKAMVAVILRGDPYSGGATDAVETLRAEISKFDPTALVGGVPAENLDVEDANARDTKLIVPAVLAVVLLILAVLLRALAAPLYLTITVVASFAATLGLVTFGFAGLGGEGIAFNLTLLAFIFLVALGVDYNIFLMTRAREEAAVHGTREGVLRALANTGGVVTSAGLVLAGTFATLTLLPLEELVQIGAAVAIGVLLDTFLVRTLLVPSITYLMGDRAWWPSSAGSADGPGPVR